MSLADLLAAKQKTLEHKAQPPCPLSILLRLYNQSDARDTYINYMEGLKLLVDWLGPFKIPVTAPCIYNSLISTYDSQEIAKLVGCEMEVITQEAVRIYLEDLEASSDYRMTENKN